MSRRIVLTGQGNATAQVVIDDRGGGGLTEIPVLQDGVLVLNARSLNFRNFEITDAGAGQANILDPNRILNGLRELVDVNTDTGNDTTGNGTLANPYKTPMRASLDAPQYCINGGSWVCRIQGTNAVEILLTWVLPIMIGDNTYSRPSTPVDPAFPVERNYNFLAVLPRVTGNSPITSAQATVSAQGPGQTFVILNSGGSVNPLYPIGIDLTGYTIRDGNGSLASIISNDTQIISIPMDASEIVFPLEIMKPGCLIHLTGTSPVFQAGSTQNSIQWGGIHFRNDETITYPHNGVANLQATANTSFVACNIKGLNTSSVNHVYVYACFLGGQGDQTNTTINGGQIDFYRCVEWSTAFDQFFMHDYRHIWCYINNSDRVGHTQGAGSFGTFTVTNCKIVNPPGESAVAYYGGAQCFATTCNISGNSIGVAAFCPGQITVSACDFTNVAAEVTVLAVNGGQILLNGPTGVNAVACDQQQQVDPATNIQVTVNGTPGTTTYGFRILTVSTNGSKSKDFGGPDRLSGIVITNAPDAITAVNNITITWTDGVAADILHYEVWRTSDQGTLTYKLGTVNPGVQTFLYDNTVTPVFGFYPPHDVISFTDWVAMGRDTDLAPYSAGPIRSRVVQMSTP